MITRTAKVLLIAAVALFYTLVVFNNLTDFDSNYQFVRHVLSMDTTFPGNHGMWRSMHSEREFMGLYLAITGWEIVNMGLLWWGAVRLIRAIRQPADMFNARKGAAVIALALSLLMWLAAFLSIGAEWFLMWQSRTWNGQDAASRMFVVVGIVLLLVLQQDRDEQP